MGEDIVLIRTKHGDLTITEAAKCIDEQSDMIEEMITESCPDCTRKALNRAGYTDEQLAAFVGRIRQTVDKALSDTSHPATEGEK